VAGPEGFAETVWKPSFPSYQPLRRSECLSPDVLKYSMWASSHCCERRCIAESTNAEATPLPCAAASTAKRPQWPTPLGVQGVEKEELMQPTACLPWKATCKTLLLRVPLSPMDSRP